MKKLILALAIIMLISIVNVNATLDSCTLNNPKNLQYDNGAIRLNATAIWTNNTAASVGFVNVTNITFTVGSSIFSNFTTNGTSTNVSQVSGTANIDTFKGDFTFTLIASSLNEGGFTTYATCYNSTDATRANVAVNSTSVTYTKDTIAPSSSISNPLKGSTVVPSLLNMVTFEYKCSDTNLGNSTLHLNNAAVKSSTSNTITPNITSDVTTSFTNKFGADNLSVRVAIVCRDLAGLEGDGANFTFNVLLGATPYAVKQAQQSGGFRQPTAGFNISPPSVKATYLQQYGWIYLILLVIIGIFVIKKVFKR